MATWLVVALFSILLSSCISDRAACPFLRLVGQTAIHPARGYVVCLIVLRHHQNIRRLLDGSEPKLGQKKSA